MSAAINFSIVFINHSSCEKHTIERGKPDVIGYARGMPHALAYRADAGLPGEGAVEAPAGGIANRPPRLLLTLLGDYWWRRAESLPSAAIVALLAEFGVSDSAAP